MNKADTLPDTVAARIRAVMAARKLNLADISGFLGLSKDAVSRRLNGRAEFSLSQIERFAYATGYKPSDFLENTFSLFEVGEAS